MRSIVSIIIKAQSAQQCGYSSSSRSMKIRSSLSLSLSLSLESKFSLGYPGTFISFHMASPLECFSEENAQFFIPFTSIIANPRLSALHDDNRCLIQVPPSLARQPLPRRGWPARLSPPSVRALAAASSNEASK